MENASDDVPSFRSLIAKGNRETQNKLEDDMKETRAEMQETKAEIKQLQTIVLSLHQGSVGTAKASAIDATSEMLTTEETKADTEELQGTKPLVALTGDSHGQDREESKPLIEASSGTSSEVCIDIKEQAVCAEQSK